MSLVIAAVVVLGVFAVTAFLLTLLARRVRRRGIGGTMGAVDEIWHPLGHDATIEMQQEKDRRAPIPSPDDH